MHEIRFGWRTRSRVSVGVVLTFLIGVIAASSDAPWPVRLLAAIAFVSGAAVCLDAVVFASSWRMTQTALKVPRLTGRQREIAGRDGLVVELEESTWSRIAVSGPNGRRTERVNPLVSGVDLRRWWNSLPDA